MTHFMAMTQSETTIFTEGRIIFPAGQRDGFITFQMGFLIDMSGAL